MRLVDFEYDGTKLSEVGFGVCNFDGGDEEQEVGNIITMNNIKGQDSDVNFASGSMYEDLFELEFQICKITCGDDSEFFISADDLKFIMRWLNRKKYLKFKPIYDDNSFSDVYYMATFNVSLIKMTGQVIGLTLQLKTNAPYGFGEAINISGTMNSTEGFRVEDTSDEIGHICCDAVIKCKQAGDLKISNSIDPNNILIVNNCSANEVITLHGATKIIESSLSGHTKLYNDFNYNFMRIVNMYTDNINVFTSTIPCEISISYSPIRKVGIVI